MDYTGNNDAGGGGSILKDSYYKERLLNSNAANMYKSHQKTGMLYSQKSKGGDVDESDDD